MIITIALLYCAPSIGTDTRDNPNISVLMGMTATTLTHHYDKSSSCGTFDRMVNTS